MFYKLWTHISMYIKHKTNGVSIHELLWKVIEFCGIKMSKEYYANI